MQMISVGYEQTYYFKWKVGCNWTIPVHAEKG